MSDEHVAYLMSYATAMIFQAWMGVVRRGQPGGRREGARLVLLAPLWPAVLLWALWHWIKTLVEDAFDDTPA